MINVEDIGKSIKVSISGSDDQIAVELTAVFKAYADKLIHNGISEKGLVKLFSHIVGMAASEAIMNNNDPSDETLNRIIRGFEI